MKKLSESIWSDIQDRSSGKVIRKEDDINHLNLDEFFYYLVDHYEKTEQFEIRVSDRIDVPLVGEKRNPSWCFNLDFEQDANGNNIISLSELFSEYFDDIYEKLKEKFLVKNEDGDIRIFPANGDKVTNQTYVDVINFVIDNDWGENVLIMIKRK